MGDGSPGEESPADDGAPARFHALVGDWYHSHEEDDREHRVYRPASHHFPGSRVPRSMMRLDDDGAASLGEPNAADATDRRPGQWQVVRGPTPTISVRTATGSTLFELLTTADGEHVLRTPTRRGTSDATEEEE